MIQTVSLAPGITLRCIRESRFKHSCLSLQCITALDSETAAMQALLPAVLLRGCESAPDMRAIISRLDENYGASVSTLVRRVGDIQTTGLYCSFLEDRFAQDRVLEDALRFLLDLFLHPVTQGDSFREDYVEGEKRNLMATVESERNDKRAYAAAQMRRAMCQGDSFALSRLGTVQEVAAITAGALYAHYRRLLATAPIELLYVGSRAPEELLPLLQPLTEGRTSVLPKPVQMPFRPQVPEGHIREQMRLAQGKLCMGFVTPVTVDHPLYVPMLLLTCLYGGATAMNKLFVHVREKLSLCYDVGAGYYGTKGIMTVSAGVDTASLDRARDEILHQLELCRQGQITQTELAAAKQSYYSSLQALPDSPGALEGFFATALLSGTQQDLVRYRQEIEAVTLEQVVAAAQTVRLHTVYYLEGEQP